MTRNVLHSPRCWSLRSVAKLFQTIKC